MANVKEGERVRIATREPTEEDVKTGMYYAHFGGLVGTVQKVYSKQEVAVEIEQESLTKDIRRRHEDVRQQMKTKWLEGMSEEGRSRLTEREKDFNLRYVVLVAMADLEKAGAKPKPPVESAISAVAHEETRPAKPQEQAIPPTPPRKTLADLEAAEEAELARRAEKARGK
jgi:ribosomal protein L21E